MVMATGIVSIASHLLEYELIAKGLLGLNIAAYLALWTLSLWRLSQFPRRFFSDLTSHRFGVGFFTMVAASCVLGSQFLVIANHRGLAVGLWIVGIALWFVLTYSIFTSFAVKAIKPTLAEGIHGGWLVSVVATQSVSLLGALLAAGFGSYHEHVLFFSLTMWLGGGMLYIWIISLIFYRNIFVPMNATELSPPYWINMGAMAISTLAGANLISAADGSHLLTDLLPFLKGFTLFFWATATWWIPMLVTLGVWRHVYKRYELKYDPQYWSIVFPLGMYATCTFRMEQALEIGFLDFIPVVFTWTGLAAWALTFAGMCWALVRRN